MATYAIGDVQGCHDSLVRLLEIVGYRRSEDRLWFVGDLVNRGPASLETLRLVRGLGDGAVVVLGNHDLHLLALHHTGQAPRPNDTLEEVLGAPDCGALLEWLRHRPVLHRDDALRYVMVHAGIPHIWSLKKAARRARELEAALRGDEHAAFFKVMYGNEPKRWKKQLEGTDRLRAITNYFTRMRIIDERGRLDLDFTGTLDDLPAAGFPWYEPYRTRPPKRPIIFGHWAALEGHVDVPGIHALDTGCVWGNPLTALCLETGERVSVATV